MDDLENGVVIPDETELQDDDEAIGLNEDGFNRSEALEQHVLSQELMSFKVI